MMYRIFIVLALCLLFFDGAAKNKTELIKGQVKNKNGEAIPFATIAVLNTSQGTVSNEDGYFSLTLPIDVKTELLIRCVSYEEKRIQLYSKEYRAKLLSIELAESNNSIDEVVLVGKSKATILREQSYAIEAIETASFKNLSVSGTDILGKISGVNVRQSGGLGSNFSVSLNGLSNNQVRIFIDGVPMDYFGTSLSLNNISANLIERVEVYKGVVPIHLSADALGGAINIVTKVNSASFVDASFSAGSYGTYLASLNSRYRNEKTGFTLDLKSFYNHADNNYKVPINLVDFATGKASETPTMVERFHDAYDSRMAWLESGFTGTRFADMFLLGLMYSDNHKEIQQAEFATGQAKIPYGEVARSEEKIIATGKYSKNAFLLPNLSLTANGVAVFAENLGADTSSYRYDWFGNKELLDLDIGEIETRKSLLTLYINNYLANSYAEYQINDKHGVAAGFSMNYLNLKGKDELKKQNDTQFKDPSTAVKNIYSLSYTNKLLNDKLKTTAFLKNYTYKLKSTSTNYQGTDEIPVEITKDFFGYGLATTYQFPKLQLKTSFEYATRFPEIIELFGDGLNVISNPGLLPESSYNYNLGGLYTHNAHERSLTLSANLFFRDTENYIRDNTTGMKTQYINDQRVSSKGIDFAGSFAYSDRFQLQVNGTYIQKHSISDNNRKIPNEPNLFGKLFLSYRFKEFMNSQNKLSINVTQHYVQSFYYRWEDLASEDKAKVPSQSPTDIEAIYSVKDGRYNFSVGLLNIFDLALYDNYNQRRPGRIYNLKFRVFIN